MLTLTSRKRLARDGRQSDGSERAEYRARQEGQPRAVTAVREENEDRGGDGGTAQRCGQAEREQLKQRLPHRSPISAGQMPRRQQKHTFRNLGPSTPGPY